MPTHSDRVHAAFSAQAGAFEDARFNRAFTTDASWLFESLALDGRELLLDVAAGTGHAARELAPRVRAAVALDLTPAMLEAGKAAAARRGIENVVFMRGDASALPFLDGSFTIVVCRYALHHFADRDAVMSEIARVLRPYGRLGLADLVADEHADRADAQNAIERMRDPSHVCALSASGLQALIVHHGLEATAAETREIRRPLGPWLEHSATPPETRTEIERRLRQEIDGGQKTGLQPRGEADGALSFVHTVTSVFALNPGQ